MRILRTEKEIASFLETLARRAGGGHPQVERTVRKVLADVKKEGDRALVRYTKKFDGHCRLKLPPDVVAEHAARAGSGLVEALEFSARRIRAFHEKQKERLGTWYSEEDGIKLGQVVRPLARVGVYVPGGKAAYPSTVLMNVIPAQVAGVEQIAVAVPSPKGELNPAVMAAIKLLGVTEVYSIGGAQAVAAFAYGTEGVPRVDKITGPGNIFVATAKKMVFGEVDIDMIAGPSEILVIADSSARPEFIAADLLSQAEHDELASSVLVTDSDALARGAIKALEEKLKNLDRRSIARESLKNYGAVILAKDLSHAARISDLIAPEHLELMVKNPDALLKKIKNAGAAFLGPWTPEPVGDYAAGPNHTLPTGGTARFSSPLGVHDFLKSTSYLKLSRRGFLRLAGAVETVAGAEGLTAHREAVSIRKKTKM